MVYSRLIKYWPHQPQHWVRLAQIFVGLFFMGAGAWKFYNYFLIGDQTLYEHAEFWLSSGWPPEWYAWFMRNIVQSHERLFASLVIIMQFVPGAMLVANLAPRWGAFLLLIIQLNIFMGVLKHTNFNEFVGSSVWLAAFYTLLPKSPEQLNICVWRMLRLAFIGLLVLLQYNRYLYGDPWLSGFEYQVDHLAKDVLSSSIYLKHSLLWLTQFKIVMYLWAAKWWLKSICVVLLLTKWRLKAAAVILVMQVGNVIIWLNGATSQAVLWVLICFSYCTMEYLLITNDPVAQT